MTWRNLVIAWTNKEFPLQNAVEFARNNSAASLQAIILCDECQMCIKINAASPIGRGVYSNHFAVVVDGKPTPVDPKGTSSLPALSTNWPWRTGYIFFRKCSWINRLNNTLNFITGIPEPPNTLRHLTGNLRVCIPMFVYSFWCLSPSYRFLRLSRFIELDT